MDKNKTIIFLNILFMVYLSNMKQINQTCAQKITDANGSCVCIQNSQDQICKTIVELPINQMIDIILQNQKPILIDFSPSRQKYYQFRIDLCLHKAQSYDQNIAFQIFQHSTNWSQPSLSTENIIFKFTAKYQCQKIFSTVIEFQSKNSKFNHLYLLFHNKKSQSMQFKMRATYFQFTDIWFLIISTFFLIVSLFLVPFLILYIRYRFYRRERNNLNEQNANELSSLNKLQQTTSKLKYCDLKQQNFKQNDKICSICLIQIQKQSIIRITLCQHIFHQQCLDKWCVKKPICPNCRKNLY